MISALLTPDYVRRMRVAIEQDLVKNMLQKSPVPADEPKARRWEWFEKTATNTSALFPWIAGRQGSKATEGSKRQCLRQLPRQ